MRGGIVGVSVVTATILASPSAAAGPQTLRPVTLLVTNLADVPGGFVSRAKSEVVGLYSRIGITLMWEDTRPTDVHILPPSAQRVLLRLTILQDDPRGLADSQALGAAPRRLDDPQVASVYYARVERAARRHDIEPAVVLGHAMAHEVAHLLMPRYEHSSAGVMKAVWDSHDYVLAAQGQLRFSDAQAALIREVLTR